MKKKFVEIERGVFRDPTLEVVRASDGKWIRYASNESKMKEEPKK